MNSPLASSAAPARASFGLLRKLGPGLVSGASDDDPSGIATYTQAGAQLGYAAFWIMPVCYPMMVVTQEISARMGRATNGGVIATLAREYPAWVVHPIVTLVLFANVLNLGADLGAMADVLKMLIGGPRLLYVILFGAFCLAALLLLSLEKYLQVVKWATLSLLAYFVTAF
ncbi:MAG: divalent metal cation transporter, partial [Acetobacteraceae bacterium]|nr:divalent metal cation transporter [Acetobacteraceae bacterium]